MIAIHTRTGAEGPQHDPYSFVETTIKVGDKRVVFHNGLGVWMKRYEGRHLYDMYEFKVVANQLINDKVRDWLGVTMTQALRWRRKAELARLRPHRSHGGAAWVRGMPGESLCICQCGEVIDTDFNEGEVM